METQSSPASPTFEAFDVVRARAQQHRGVRALLMPRAR